jgi:20S proteasome alpha/beta subunit
MSLVFSLLQKDYIIVAADSRHTRGDYSGGLYKNDRGVKTVEVMHGVAVLGFAGHDRGEHIISRAISSGMLENGETLLQLADQFFPFASQEYERQYPPGTEFPPVVEFLLAGWSRHGGTRLATAYSFRLPGQVSYTECTYPHRWFEIIGKSCHGALYALHRFGNQELPLDSALRLSAFVMREICEQDTSTGGEPQIYLLTPDEKVTKKTPGEIEALKGVAKTAGSQLEQYLLLGRD